MSATVAVALLILRVVAGLTVASHGAQKLFGWFDGPGMATWEQGLQKQGFRPARVWAYMTILGELGGGLSLAFGFLTPLGAAGALGAMVMAIRTHWKKGFFNSTGGFEYPLALLVMSAAIGITGPGAYSLDTLFGVALPQLPIFLALALAALVVDAIGIFITRPTPAAAQPPRTHAA